MSLYFQCDTNLNIYIIDESHAKKANRIQNYNAENSLESVSCTSKDESCSQDQDYDKVWIHYFQTRMPLPT